MADNALNILYKEKHAVNKNIQGSQCKKMCNKSQNDLINCKGPKKM